MSTYLSHENGQTAVPTDEAHKYAKAYKASPGWILTGEGEIDAQNLVKLMGYIGAGAEIEPEHEQVPSEGLDEIELPPPVTTGGIDAVAFEVRGDSMWPKYEAGDLIICSSGPRNPDDFLRQFVAVRTNNGHRYLKRLRPGSRRGLYTLESFNGEPIENVKIAWIGEVLAVVPAHRRNASVAPRKRANG